jgi:N-acetyl-gamma-glutamyl-phosphate reductase
LCLPDAASKESVSLVTNPDVRIIDASTAHRTEEGWAYGYPELSDKHREAIKTGKRVAVPGCYATGFITIAYPLVKGGLIPEDYPVSAFAVSGYSGAGKKTIAVYEDPNRDKEYGSPREYALSQQHKHLKEMKKISGLSRTPLFSPIIADYYSGMFVSLPFYADMMNGKNTPESVHAYMSDYYKDQKFIRVMPFGSEADANGFIGSNNLSGWDGLQLFVTGNEERILLTTRFDNLGKGASGAAIQCMNIMIGCDEDKGLNL